jgi:predicted permease
MSALSILPDLRLALHALRRSPGFTLIAVVTLGAGIGANTSAFSIVNEVLLRPQPYPDSASLDRIYRATRQSSRGGVSPADYLDLKAQANGYGQIAAYTFADMSLAAPGEAPEMARGLRVSADFFPILGLPPQLGRVFRAHDTVPGNDHVVMLSHRLWQTRFGGDPQIVGRSLRVDGEVHVVVGVLPAAVSDWRYLGPFDLFRPLALGEKEAADRSGTLLRLLGRRARAVSRAQGDAFIADFGRRLAAEFPAQHAGSQWRTLSLSTATAPDNGPGIFAMLIGLSTFVLLIACSNLANLLLARTMARARELAVRSALGASRARLLRPLLAESLLLALAGGLSAVAFAAWTNHWMRGYMDRATFVGVGDTPVFLLDWRVLGWTFGACLFTAVVFGVAPALFALRLDLNRTLKTGARGTTGGRGHQRFRHLLIVGQFAFAMILLAGAGVFGRGVQELNRRPYGWDSSRLVTGSLLLPAATYRDDQQVADFQRLALERLEALPGVESASFSYAMPFFGLAEARKYAIAGRQPPAPGQEPVAVTNGVSPHYFDTVGTHLVSGRVFTDDDRGASPRVYVINKAMARALYPGQDPVGRRLARAGGEDWGEIVGVVGDVQSVYPDRVPIPYQVYQPLAQEPRRGNPIHEIAVRTRGAAPAAVIDDVRTTIAALDPDLPLRQLQPADAAIASVNYQWGVLSSMLSFLATLGLGLASLGVYGVITRTMAQRSSEFGIRLALGATAGDIRRLVLGAGARLAVIGSALGLVGALGIVRLLAAFFPLLPTSSVTVLAAVTALLVAVSLIASYLPACQASRINPTEALRAE